jgi:hypothetical protein
MEKLGIVYSNLKLMNSDSRIVSNSKALHFLLPDLVMPMDTLECFKIKENKKNFLYPHSRGIFTNLSC